MGSSLGFALQTVKIGFAMCRPAGTSPAEPGLLCCWVVLTCTFLPAESQVHLLSQPPY